MMRGPKKSAMAVRNPDGEIVLEKWDTQVSKRPKFFKLPIIRGLFNFIDSMSAGYKCLMRSAEISGLEELSEEMEKEKKAKKAKKNKNQTEETTEIETVEQVSETAEATEACVSEEITETDKAEEAVEAAEEKPAKKDSSSALMTGIMAIASVLGVALALLLFMWLPSFLYKLCEGFLHVDNLALNSLIKSAFEGILKIAVLIAYMSLVSLMNDIKRTFMYHGAEHKTIFCYEHGMELTVENVRKEGRFHPRCGTSFLILMLLVGIFISFLIDPLFILITGAIPKLWLRVLIKIILLPLIMGIGYELIKLAGKHQNLLTRIISAPGLWLQRLTVKEPTDDMIECAIAAFVEVIPDDGSDKI
ncbi:MAG: DUF1385 domain-containing protein [Clostridia bacterium]|nr:DUF1385 domain-containing protein [Clostridia bacterium]